jgi:hypothetical protein
MAWAGRKCEILIAIPSVGTVNMEWALNFAILLREAPANTFVATAPEPMIDVAREKLGEIAVSVGAHHVFFLDSDIVTPPDVINRLLKHDLPFVSGLYVRRHHPPFNEMLRKHPDGYQPIADGEYEKGALVSCDAVGLGCSLVKTDVFKDIERPWFRWTEHSAQRGASEDFYFCKKVRATGFKIHCDTSIGCKHIGTFKWLPGDQFEYPIPGGIQVI